MCLFRFFCFCIISVAGAIGVRLVIVLILWRSRNVCRGTDSSWIVQCSEKLCCTRHLVRVFDLPPAVPHTIQRRWWCSHNRSKVQSLLAIAIWSATAKQSPRNAVQTVEWHIGGLEWVSGVPMQFRWKLDAKATSSWKRSSIAHRRSRHSWCNLALFVELDDVEWGRQQVWGVRLKWFWSVEVQVFLLA